MTIDTKYDIGDWVRVEMGPNTYYGEVTTIIVRLNKLSYRISAFEPEVSEKEIKEVRRNVR